MIARMTLTRMAALVYAVGDLKPMTGEEDVIELQHIEVPEIPFIQGPDRPAWQTKYGPAQSKSRRHQ